MILIFGGTTEGRIAAETVDEAGQPFFYSTRGTLQEVEGRNMVRLTGEMNREEITSFCREHRIRLIVDAAHPFAAQLHANIDGAAKDTGIQVVRLERLYPQLPGDIIRCESFDEAILRMKRDGIKKLLALTGTQTIGKLKPFWQENDCIFRILRRDESVERLSGRDSPKKSWFSINPKKAKRRYSKRQIRKPSSPKRAVGREDSSKR